MPVSADSVAVALIEGRFKTFTAAPIAIVGDGSLAFDPSIQEYLNGSGDSPAGPQPLDATWTVQSVRETKGYVQLTVELLEGSNLGLTAGLSAAGAFNQPEITRLVGRFAVVSPPGHTDVQVQETFRLIRFLYERSALTDSGHVDWPTLQVRNRPLDGAGSAWREVLERDTKNSWRNDRTTGEFETSPFLRPWASTTGASIEVGL